MLISFQNAFLLAFESRLLFESEDDDDDYSCYLEIAEDGSDEEWKAAAFLTTGREEREGFS